MWCSHPRTRPTTSAWHGYTPSPSMAMSSDLDTDREWIWPSVPTVPSRSSLLIPATARGGRGTAGEQPLRSGCGPLAEKFLRLLREGNDNHDGYAAAGRYSVVGSTVVSSSVPI